MKTKTQLGVESLDQRDMPSITLAGGILTLNGFGNDDVASVRYVGDKVQARLYTYGPTGPLGTGLIGQSVKFNIASVHQIIFTGKDGDDRFTNETLIPCIANGEAGNDILIGGSSADLLRGGIGNDTLEGRGGGDTLKGAAGMDTLKGGAGADQLFGGINDDKLYGGTNVDVLKGEDGNDYLHGGTDGVADVLIGGVGGMDTFVIDLYPGGNRDFPIDLEPGEVFV